MLEEEEEEPLAIIIGETITEQPNENIKPKQAPPKRKKAVEQIEPIEQLHTEKEESPNKQHKEEPNTIK